MRKRHQHTTPSRACFKQPPDTEALWQEAKPVANRDENLWVLDDRTLDKLYDDKIKHVTWPWSKKHGRRVSGINLMALLKHGSLGGRTTA